MSTLLYIKPYYVAKVGWGGNAPRVIVCAATLNPMKCSEFLYENESGIKQTCEKFANFL